MSTVIAVPSTQPGGLEAPLGAHFGHCDLYTLISIDDGQIAQVDVIPNVPHQQGGCMAPVQYLADKGAKILIAGGMGMRPLMGFSQVGITVYHNNPAVPATCALLASTLIMAVGTLVGGRQQES